MGALLLLAKTMTDGIGRGRYMDWAVSEKQRYGIGRVRYMDWAVSEKQKYGHVLVSGQVEHGLIPIQKPVP